MIKSLKNKPLKPLKENASDQTVIDPSSHDQNLSVYVTYVKTNHPSGS